jgi:hypothetical protein
MIKSVSQQYYRNNSAKSNNNLFYLLKCSLINKTLILDLLLVLREEDEINWTCF